VGCKAEDGSKSDDSRPWALGEFVFKLHCVLKHTCLSFAIDHCETRARRNGAEPSQRWDNYRGFYVIAWTLLLLGFWFWNPDSPKLLTIFGAAAAYRAYEIAVTGLGTALGDEAQFQARNLITIAFYGLQMVLIFAIVYHSFAGGCFEVADKKAADQHLAKSDYLYISWANFTSLGQDTYKAKSDVAEFLEVLTTTMGIMVFGVLLAFGINEVRNPGNRPEAPAKPTNAPQEPRKG
jgi:hypothetical protein